ncbi:MAG: 4'-phosphopantetheinyl transferase superfamily protein [Schleiferiaceae bacterium]|nr:4'-phosphopantetheinyl transferase superfamily protein [Schleiferiaceae bacterium]
MPAIKHLKPFENVAVVVWEITETDEAVFQFFQTGDAFKKRLAEITHPQKRIEHLASRAALDIIYPESTVYYEGKKPLLTDGSFLSFSHNSQFAACGRSVYKPIGIDLEASRPELLQKVKHKFLHPEEEKFAKTNRDLQIIWGAKEALYKFYGHGGIDFKNHLRIFEPDFSKNTGYFTGAIAEIAAINVKLFYQEWQNQTLVVAVGQ